MTQDSKKEIKKKSQSYLKYSGLAFQLLGIVGFSFFIGRYLDNKIGFNQPYIAISLIIVTFTGYLYKLYQELFNDKEQ